MAEWAHVALDAVALLFSVFACIFSWINRKGEAHKAAIGKLTETMEQADREIFQRLNLVERGLAQTAETLKHQPTIDHIDGLRQTINLMSGQLASSMGEMKGEMRATTRQVDLMNAYLMREKSE